MAKNQIDKLFQDKLKKHEKAPNALLWDKLETLLDEQGGIHQKEESKRRGFMWISVAASVIILAILFGLWRNYAPTDKDNLEANHEISTEQNDSTGKKEDLLQPEKENNLANEDKKENLSLPEKLNNPQDDMLTKNPDKEKKTIKEDKNKKPIFKENREKQEELVKNQDNKIKPEEDKLKDLDKKETQIVKNEKQDKPTQNNSFKVVVTVKLSSKISDEEVFASNNEKKKGAGKVLQQIKDFKNGESEPGDFKIFGIDADKALASIGKNVK